MDTEVSEERLRADIEANGHIGEIDAEEGWGRTVLTGTDADGRARDRFVDRLEDAGLDVRVDPVGNIAGRWEPAGADPDAPAVAAGSHLDSVPEGGIFDGPLGAYGALEAVRAMRDAGVEPERPVEVVSWTEEEGVRFGAGLLGSSVAVGLRSVESALEREDDDGVALGAELERIGYRGDGEVDPAGWDAWFELHVEQGTRLESAGEQVGIVDAIAGITDCHVVFEGEADHAGATPMDERRDALAAAGEFVLDVERAAREVSDGVSGSAVSTVGRIEVSPNVHNVVPGRVELTADVRDVDAAAIDAMVDRARGSADRIAGERPVEASFEAHRVTGPTGMDDRPTAAARRAAERAGIDATGIPSAALHDTAIVARETEAALLFAPSEEGISHSPREWTDWADCAAATRVLSDAMAELATRPASGGRTR